MNIEQIREYCLAKPDSFECFPFDDTALVFKTTLKNGTSKMFALVALDKPNYIILKCNPEQAIELRERFAEIEPAYHMNKKHWNGIYTDGALSPTMVYRMIDHSYNLIVSPKKSMFEEL